MDKKEYFEYLKAWEECLQVAEGCYYTATCKDPAIGAHVVSKAWLQTLASQGKVYWFSRNKGVPKEVIEGLEKGEGARKLFRRMKKSQPSLVPIGLATSSKFCCKQHDREFNPIDSRGNMNLQDPDTHHLNLMFYRALLRQLHVDTAKKALDLRQPDVEAGWSLLPQFDEDSADNLQQPRQVLQQALGAKKGGAWCIRHEVRHIQGHPCIAAACAASWRPGEGLVARDDLKCTGAWGCTVIPHDGGHLVAYHYCTTLPKGPRAKKDLEWKKNFLLTKVIKEDVELPFSVSRDLLELCEEICLAPSVWNTYSSSTQKAIQDVFSDDIGGLLGGNLRVHPQRGINLFV